QIGEQRGIHLDAAGILAVLLLADQVPGGHHDLALALRYLVLLAPAAPAWTAGHLRLLKAAVEGLDVDEEHVGLGAAGAVPGLGVVADQVTGLQGDLAGWGGLVDGQTGGGASKASAAGRRRAAVLLGIVGDFALPRRTPAGIIARGE